MQSNDLDKAFKRFRAAQPTIKELNQSIERARQVLSGCVDPGREIMQYSGKHLNDFPIDQIKRAAIERGLCASGTKETTTTPCQNKPVWSKTPPTVPGWYWWRGSVPDRAGTFMVEVVDRFYDGLTMVFHEFPFDIDDERIYSIYIGNNVEWCGPLTPPE